MPLGSEIHVDVSKAVGALEKLNIVFRPIEFTKLIGQRWLQWINENFRAQGLEDKWQPLSPNTLASRRGGGRGAQILRDSGALAQSFVPGSQDNVNRTDNQSVTVGTQNRVAEFHHKGTRPFTIFPVRAQFLRFETPQGPRFVKKVNHPGLPQRRLLPTPKTAEGVALEVVRAKIAQKIQETGAGR